MIENSHSNQFGIGEENSFDTEGREAAGADEKVGIAFLVIFPFCVTV